MQDRMKESMQKQKLLLSKKLKQNSTKLSNQLSRTHIRSQDKI